MPLLFLPLPRSLADFKAFKIICDELKTNLRFGEAVVVELGIFNIAASFTGGPLRGPGTRVVSVHVHKVGNQGDDHDKLKRKRNVVLIYMLLKQLWWRGWCSLAIARSPVRALALPTFESFCYFLFCQC